ncbi:MAG: FtsQ-type POTRA domain-containing protein [Candidatus Limnocylindrales bacterium]
MTQRPTTRRPVSSRPSGRGQVAARPMRRSRRVRRASGGLSPIRAGAMLGLLLAGAALYGVAHSSAFTFTRVDLRGAAFTDTAAVDALLVDARQRNLFVLSTRPLVERLRTLPTVANAAVTVRLPNALVVSLKEREAILVWRVGERRYLADPEGNLFARMDGDVVPEEVAALPVVEDRRAASAGLSIGRRLEAVDRDAATRLASLRPSDVGSASARLQVVDHGRERVPGPG